MADGAFGFGRLADLSCALHAEQVVAAGHEGRRHLALEAHKAVPVDPGAYADEGRDPGAAFEATQHPRGETDVAAASLGVGGRAAGQGRGRAGGVAGGGAAGAGSAREGTAARAAGLQPGESAEGVALGAAGQWVIQGYHACVLRQGGRQPRSDGTAAEAAAVASQGLLLRGCRGLVPGAAVDERCPDVGSTELEAKFIRGSKPRGRVASKGEAASSAAGASAERTGGAAPLVGLSVGAEAV